MLRNLRDTAQIEQMIRQGGVEMPAFALQLDQSRIELLSHYIGAGMLPAEEPHD
jgi:mono/diheme cytochrome c family protein